MYSLSIIETSSITFGKDCTIIQTTNGQYYNAINTAMLSSNVVISDIMSNILFDSDIATNDVTLLTGSKSTASTRVAVGSCWEIQGNHIFNGTFNGVLKLHATGLLRGEGSISKIEILPPLGGVTSIPTLFRDAQYAPMYISLFSLTNPVAIEFEIQSTTVYGNLQISSFSASSSSIQILTNGSDVSLAAGEYLYLIQYLSAMFPLNTISFVDETNNPISEYSQIDVNGVNLVASFITQPEPATGIFFSLHENHTPNGGNDESCSVTCDAGEDCGCCVNVSPVDPDPNDTITVTVNSGGHSCTANTTNVCCIEPSIASTTSYTISYVVQDNIGASDTISIDFHFEVLPTPSPSHTVTPSPTASTTSSISNSATPSLTPSPSATASSSPSPSLTPSVTSSSTPSLSLGVSPSRTSSISPSNTRTTTRTRSTTKSPSISASTTSSSSISESPSKTSTVTQSESSSSSISPSPTISQSTSQTISNTPSATRTKSGTPSSSRTASISISASPSPSRSGSMPGASPNISTSPSLSKSLSSSHSKSLSTSKTRTSSNTISPSKSSSETNSRTPPPSQSNTVSSSIFLTTTPTATPSPSGTESSSYSPTMSLSPSNTQTSSVSPSSSISLSSSQSSSISISQSNTKSTSISISTTISESASRTVSPSKVIEISGLLGPTPMSSPSIILIGNEIDDNDYSYNPPNDGISIDDLIDENGIPLVVVPQFTPLGLPIVISFPNDELVGASDLSSVKSIIVDINVADGNNQNLGGNVEICFKSEEEDSEDLCLGFLDETTNPPEWKCEDKCLEENNDNLLCGETEHFTNFALLLSGGLNGGGSACESSSTDWITGSIKGDFILLSTCVAVIILCLLIILCVSITQPGKRVIYGKEGFRIQNARVAQAKASI